MEWMVRLELTEANTFRDLNTKRKDYLSWEEYFIAMAYLSALRSKDPSTQVGAICCVIKRASVY